MAEVTQESRLHGAILGLAYGDAWASTIPAPTHSDFSSENNAFSTTARVSTQTQTALHVIAAVLADLHDRDSDIHRLNQRLDIPGFDELRVKVARSLLHWLHDPDNNRNPDPATVGALQLLDVRAIITGREGAAAGGPSGRGLSRSPWLGLLPSSVNEELVGLIAATQASITHSNPISVAVAAVTALTVRHLHTGVVQPGHGNVYADLVHSTTQLLNGGGVHVLPHTYGRGLEALHHYLTGPHSQEAVQATLDAPATSSIRQHIGVTDNAAAEMLLAAVITDISATRSPLDVLQQVVNSGGETKTLSPLAGTLLGAAHGDSIFPAEWLLHLEPRYQVDLLETIDLLQAEHTG